MPLAATQNAQHTCPLSDGPKPHIGGPLLQGSPTVYFENKMAGREGDPLQCFSPSLDEVQKGSNTVFINGQAAARVGDMTSHGGQITTGVTAIFIG